MSGEADVPTLSRSCPGKHGRCANIVTGGERFCKECLPTARKREQQRPEKVARDAIYRTQRWRRYRGMFLRANPLCAECQRNGRINAASVVDHIVPHRGNASLFSDPENHQALCESCHGKKSATETTN